MEKRRKIVIGITGASGSIYAKKLIHYFEQNNEQIEIGIVASKNAQTVWELELQEPFDLTKREYFYDPDNFMAPFASGSARYMQMVIVPCSMGTLGRIANGISDDLITRAADVMLKEKRQLICVVRDTPYNSIHLQNMLTLTQIGVLILPASPSFYSLPNTISDLADTVVHRILDQLNFPIDTFRWGK